MVTRQAASLELRVIALLAALSAGGAILATLPRVLGPSGASALQLIAAVVPWTAVLAAWAVLLRRSAPEPRAVAALPARVFRSGIAWGIGAILAAQLALVTLPAIGQRATTVVVMTTLEDLLYGLGLLVLGALAAFALSRAIVRPLARGPAARAGELSLRTRLVASTAGASFATTGILLDVLVDFERASDAELVGYLLLGAGLVAFATLLGWLVGDDMALREQASAAAAAERDRIARELHDGVAKSVSILALEAATAASRAPAEFRPELAKIHRIARMLSEEMRAIVSDVRTSGEPPSFIDAVSRVVSRHDLVELAIEGDVEQIGTLARFEILRIVDEALTNAQRHSKARRVRARIALDGAHVVVEVEDDGVGLPAVDWEQLAGSGRYGLIGIRERAVILGGDVAVEKSPLGGTLLRVDVPLIA